MTTHSGRSSLPRSLAAGVGGVAAVLIALALGVGAVALMGWAWATLLNALRDGVSVVEGVAFVVLLAMTVAPTRRSS